MDTPAGAQGSWWAREGAEPAFIVRYCGPDVCAYLVSPTGQELPVCPPDATASTTVRRPARRRHLCTAAFGQYSTTHSTARALPSRTCCPSTVITRGAVCSSLVATGGAAATSMGPPPPTPSLIWCPTLLPPVLGTTAATVFPRPPPPPPHQRPPPSSRQPLLDWRPRGLAGAGAPAAALSTFPSGLVDDAAKTPLPTGTTVVTLPRAEAFDATDVGAKVVVGAEGGGCGGGLVVGFCRREVHEPLHVARPPTGTMSMGDGGGGGGRRGPPRERKPPPCTTCGHCVDGRSTSRNAHAREGGAGGGASPSRRPVGAVLGAVTITVAVVTKTGGGGGDPASGSSSLRRRRSSPPPSQHQGGKLTLLIPAPCGQQPPPPPPNSPPPPLLPHRACPYRRSMAAAYTPGGATAPPSRRSSTSPTRASAYPALGPKKALPRPPTDAAVPR